MTLEGARRLLTTVEGRNAWWIRDYGLSSVREAIRVVRNRKSSTQQDHAQADAVEWSLHRS